MRLENRLHLKLILIFLFCGLCPLAADEPPIYALTLTNSVNLSNQTITLHQYLQPNPEISTPTGEYLFEMTQDGIIVTTAGLYRLSFFQRIGGTDSANSLKLILSLDDVYIKRYKDICVEQNELGELSFTQILRIEAGQKILIGITVCQGSITLSSGLDSSGFTLEKL